MSPPLGYQNIYRISPNELEFFQRKDKAGSLMPTKVKASSHSIHDLCDPLGAPVRSRDDAGPAFRTTLGLGLLGCAYFFYSSKLTSSRYPESGP